MREELKTQLNMMVGNTYIRDNIQHSIDDYREEIGHVIIVADSQEFRIPIDQLEDNLRLFEPVGMLPAHVNHSKGLKHVKSAVKQNDLDLMRSSLVETLEKVKADSNYIPQANSISKICGSIMQVAKTELEMRKAAIQGII
tara:strand:+ start:2661 stop:3083 length:423 start_codon:yes stop_codon:yes gene_type:complete